MNRLTLSGTKKEFQSATSNCGQRDVAEDKLRLNRVARLRHSGRLVAEYSSVNHKTGRPPVSFMTLSITQAGYQDSDFDNMSFVPRATTTAVVLRVIFEETVVAPTRAVRPTRASMVTRVQMRVFRVRVANDPKASDPTVRESPTNSMVPWPLAPMVLDRLAAKACTGEKAATRSAAVNIEATA
jgi:hypothetical protein